jgi:ankyrin repeat protein
MKPLNIVITTTLLIFSLQSCGPAARNSGNPELDSRIPELQNPELRKMTPNEKTLELIRAVADDNLGRVRELLASGADINAMVSGSNGHITPLLAAVASNRVDMAQFLILKGADTKITYLGYTPEAYYHHRGLHRSPLGQPWPESKSVKNSIGSIRGESR